MIKKERGKMREIQQENTTISVVMAGHVDHGKSTVLGRMLADANGLPQGKLEQVKASCERNSKPFEYAFLIDALKEEQSQGITIDSARVFFKTEKRKYIIIDAPGHIEFLKNMITGASRAEAAVLVIDAAEGVRENSKRHGFFLSTLGIKQIAVVVNKMDLVSYDRDTFEKVTKEYGEFLKEINIEPKAFIPVSGLKGDNIVSNSPNMPWYEGDTVLSIIEKFQNKERPIDCPFRMPVQGVYKFTKFDDDRRIVAGTVSTGKLRTGEEVIFYPSGKKSLVKEIEEFNVPEQPEEISAGKAAGFTLEEQIYITRGELASRVGDPPPKVTSRMQVSLFWLSPKPMVYGKEYLFKLGTTRVPVRLEKIEGVLDTSDLDTAGTPEKIEKNVVAECVLQFKRPVAFDLVADSQETGRFVIVDDYDISGGGIILDALQDENSWVRDKVMLRNSKWIKSMIPHEVRVRTLKQTEGIVLITGKYKSGRKTLAKYLEETLFLDRRFVYYLGLGNVLYGVDADIKGSIDLDTREEHIRRLAEVAHIMLDAGVILLVTAIELTKSDIDLMKIALGDVPIETIWCGKEVTTDVTPDMKFEVPVNIPEAATEIIQRLKEKGILLEREF